MNSTERDDLDFERNKRREREDRERRERDLPAMDREAIQMERDSRTVFAINLPIRASERKLYEFFEKAGKIIDVSVLHSERGLVRFLTFLYHSFDYYFRFD